jgi:hypothetical protein
MYFVFEGKLKETQIPVKYKDGVFIALEWWGVGKKKVLKKGLLYLAFND